MLKRYKVKLQLKFNFDLDGKTKQDIEKEVDYLISQATILNLPGSHKKKKLKIKEIRRKKDE